jgi:CDP-glycerol glycerophosphotransferase (TagB/SpsB family)
VENGGEKKRRERQFATSGEFMTPNEPSRIAFLFQIASFWPSWETFFLECINDNRFDVKFYLVQDGIDVSQHAKSAERFLQENNLDFISFNYSDFKQFNPHFAVIQTPYETLHRKPHLYSRHLKMLGIKVIYIPYGIELTDTVAARHDHFREPVLKNAYRIYTLSNGFKREYEKYCENAKAVRAFGMPRFDSLIQKQMFTLSNDLLAKIKGRKIVVWHTHFAKVILDSGIEKQVTPYLEEYIEFAKKLADYKNELFFIFLPHPRFGDDAVNEANNKKSAKLLEIIGSAPNTYIDKANDYRPSLLNANAIITDRSALMIESAVVGVPVLYLENVDYSEPIFPPLVPLIESYYKGTGNCDIVKFLDMVCTGNDEKKSAREAALCKCIPYMDGKCAERIKNDILSSNFEQPLQKKEKIIIFGTGFLYKKIMSFYKFPDNCEIIALSDNNIDKWGSVIDGFRVLSPQELNSLDFDKVIIMATNVFEEQIYKQLKFDLEVPENKIENCEYLAELL